MKKELYVENSNVISRACEAMRMDAHELILGENGSAQGRIMKIERRGSGFAVTVEVWE